MSRFAPSPTGGTTPPLPPTAPSFPPPPPVPSAKRRRPRWVTPLVVTGALLVGAGIGGASGSTPDPTTSDQYKALAAQLATAHTDTVTARAAANTAQDQAAADTKDADTRQTALDKRAKTLDAKSKTLDARDKSLDKREKTVAGAEKKAKASEIEDGTWTVGVDVAPGTYKVKEAVGSMCYWAILRTGSNGDDIISNDLPTGGYPSVTLKKGQDFENQCGTWKKIS